MKMLFVCVNRERGGGVTWAPRRLTHLTVIKRTADITCLLLPPDPPTLALKKNPLIPVSPSLNFSNYPLLLWSPPSLSSRLPPPPRLICAPVLLSTHLPPSLCPTPPPPLSPPSQAVPDLLGSDRSFLFLDSPRQPLLPFNLSSRCVFCLRVKENSSLLL